MESAGLPPGPEGARWLSTQILRELARVNVASTNRASDHAPPTTLKRRRASGPSYLPSKRTHTSQSPADMLGIEDALDDPSTIEEFPHPEIPILSAQKASVSEIQRNLYTFVGKGTVPEFSEDLKR
ncbi:hypothetical protein PG994_010205 [Apiospora phragmitis]|uniref:Uncharacterized protein n=1 Tax=Apiospora phragmitis TaxID=2905665 RepID=A0ABR1TP81_9PEZI